MSRYLYLPQFLISSYSPNSLCLKLIHHFCVCNNKVKDNIGQNTTGLLVGCSFGVNETTCFNLLGGHDQVYKC